MSTATGPESSSLIEYTRFLQRQNWRMRSEKVVDTLRKLPPLNGPKKDNDALNQLDKEFWLLKRVCLSLLFLIHTIKIYFL